MACGYEDRDGEACQTMQKHECADHAVSHKEKNFQPLLTFMKRKKESCYTPPLSDI